MSKTSTKSTDLTQPTFDQSVFNNLFSIEDRHFWFRIRRDIIAALTRQITVELPNGYRVLEIGCGTGNVMQTLEKVCTKGQVYGLDLFFSGLEYARLRTQTSLIQANVDDLPFESGKFHLVGMFDVLEHLEYDEQVLESIFQILIPGGKLLLTVPAHPQLWSTFDISSHHRRRYELEGLENKLLKTGFLVEYGSECMFSLYPLARMRKKAPREIELQNIENQAQIRHHGNCELAIWPGLNWLAFWCLHLELGWIKKHKRIPVGTSLVLLALKQ